MASSYANELNGRATALLKQMEVDGASTPIKGHHLSVGDHLKNANPSDFLHLMDWYNTVHRWQARADGLSEADRVRTGQRLFGDHYWSKVNEVQANGQGNVRMAFIRDAIGNWNLRSFDNDPKELLEAYREFTKAGVALATKVTTGGADPAAALGVANQMINNQLGSAGVAAASNKEISALRRRLIKDIEQAREDLKEAKTLPEALSSHQREARESFDNAQGSVDEKEREVASLEEQLAALQDDDAEQRTNLETRHTSAKAELELAKRQRDQSKAALDEIDKQVAAVVGSKVKQVLDGVKADLRSHLDIIDGLKAAEVADNESKPVQPLKTITNGGKPDPPS